MKTTFLFRCYGHLKNQNVTDILTSLSGLLVSGEGHILDIKQSITHDFLTVSILFTSMNKSNGLGVKLETMAQSLSMKSDLEQVAEEALDNIHGDGSARYVVTVLSRYVSMEHLHQVLVLSQERHLKVDSIRQLATLPDAQQAVQKRSAIEIVLIGKGNVESLHRDFLSLSSELNIDIAFQLETPFRRAHRLVCFDMDSTLIATEVIDELAAAAGVGEQVAEITESAMRGEIDFTESFHKRMGLLKGLDESVLESIAEQLPIMEGAERLFTALNALGYKTAILSGGFMYFAQHLQKKLGIDYIHANELEVVEGKVTGRVTGRVVDGQRKAELLERIAQDHGIPLSQVVAVGDGANDLPMLSKAGLGVAFRAKPLVREKAKYTLSTLGLDGLLYMLGIED
ncbi:phosphoserine phosphatase SerB [Marinibactrum halimedae]|uniref:phosphoserine phosphatase SerB n=1 Tax=Marinibactrum halimedae TaxID=1444977 RepID=UPI001E5D9D1D|nr:phosphoserine phosphatase SerB [Marinibactrum halimedae]MCD9460253.1 phosphoserine phosphatase SerB [Marinibactrum halimedae]